MRTPPKLIARRNDVYNNGVRTLKVLTSFDRCIEVVFIGEKGEDFGSSSPSAKKSRFEETATIQHHTPEDMRVDAAPTAKEPIVKGKDQKLSKRKVKWTERQRTYPGDSSDESEDDNIDGNEVDMEDDNLTLLNILLVSPEQFERKEKPTGVHHDFLCTLNRDLLSVESCRADDNGAYLRHCSPSRYYKVELDENGGVQSAVLCHWDNNLKQLYYNSRGVGVTKYDKVYFDDYPDVNELKKMDRKSKASDGF